MPVLDGGAVVWDGTSGIEVRSNTETGWAKLTAGVLGVDTIDTADVVGLDAQLAALSSSSHTHANSATLAAITAAFTTALETKLNGIASGATANDTDANLKNRANHTGTQAASTISDFAEAVDDRVDALLVEGSNITLTYNDGAGTLTIDAAGGGAGTNLAATLSATNTIITSDTGTDATIPAVDGTNAGVMTPTQKGKLDGIASGATANSSDATLLDRANHTGTQAQSTVTNLVSDLSNKQPLDADLTTIAGLTATTDNFLVAVASAWASRTPAQVKTTLALNNVDNTSDANKPVSTATQTALDGKQPLDADLTTIAGLTATTDNFLVSVASAWASRTPAQVRTTLGLVIGTNVQAFSSVLQNTTASFTTADETKLDALPSTFPAVVSALIDGGGSAITTGIKFDLKMPEYAGTITKWTLLADVSGSIVVDLWKDTYANYPPIAGDSITASAKPTISAATKGQSSTLTGWTTSFAAGDIIRVNVDSASTVTRVTLVLDILRS